MQPGTCQLADVRFTTSVKVISIVIFLPHLFLSSLKRQKSGISVCLFIFWGTEHLLFRFLRKASGPVYTLTKVCLMCPLKILMLPLKVPLLYQPYSYAAGTVLAAPNACLNGLSTETVFLHLKTSFD